MKAKKKLEELKACKEAVEWVEEMTLQDAWNKCERGDWMLWLYAKLYPNNLRELTLAKGHCANTVRHLMKDERSINAVDIAIAFGEGKITEKELYDASSAAHAAYYSSAADTSVFAAYAAAYAASTAAYAAAYAAVYAAYARKKNRKQTADICRKYLKPDFLSTVVL